MEKLKELPGWIQKHKFIVGLAVVFIVLVFVFLPEDTEQIQQEVQERQVAATQSLPAPIIQPKQGAVALGNTKNSISLFFTVSIDTQTVRITSTPDLGFEAKIVNDFPKRLLLRPSSPWVAGQTYTITVKKGLRSIPYGGDELLDTVFELTEDLVLTYTATEIQQPIYPAEPI